LTTAGHERPDDLRVAGADELDAALGHEPHEARDPLRVDARDALEGVPRGLDRDAQSHGRRSTRSSSGP
jgi:hypothetical protein